MDRINLPALFFFNIVLAILGLLPLYTDFRIYFDSHKIAFLDFGWDYIKSSSIITTGGDCIHEIKRHLLLGRKAMTNLDSILKSRYITLLTKVYIVKAMVFPVVMYGCKSWTIKKAEHWWIDVFELWYWRRLLRVPWTAKRSKQFILKEINPEYSLEGLVL